MGRFPTRLVHYPEEGGRCVPQGGFGWDVSPRGGHGCLTRLVNQPPPQWWEDLRTDMRPESCLVPSVFQVQRTTEHSVCFNLTKKNLDEVALTASTLYHTYMDNSA